jgi:predicted nucleotidyltransferase
MRLSTEHRQALRQHFHAARGENCEVLVFGSRLDDQARGGDVDVLVVDPQTLLQPVHRVANERLFTTLFDFARVASLNSNGEDSERTDAFFARFGRLQDTLGDKLLPELLSCLGEKPRHWAPTIPPPAPAKSSQTWASRTRCDPGSGR